MTLDHIVLLASDLGRSLRFYETLLPLLGYEKARDHVFTSPDAPAIDLRQAGDAKAAYGRHAPGLNHFGFSAPDVAFLETVRTVMDEAGFEAPAIQSFPDGRAVFLADPDGLRVEVGTYGPA